MQVCMSMIRLVFLVIVSLLSTSVTAQKYALLVGVGDYPNLPESAQLLGPENDIEIIQNVLFKNKFDKKHIHSLVTKQSFESPTRDNILTRLEQLVTVASEDDFFYLHFSGHGSRQPAKAQSNDEADGLDEIFLPTDVGEWNKETGVVENAIVDNEIAYYINAIRDRGADVWIVFDSCHSGTMTRGAAMPDIRFRQVAPSILDIPKIPANKPRSTTSVPFSQWNVPSHDKDTGLQKALFHADTNSVSTSRGELIAFSAAQSTQTTPEMKLPRSNDASRFHGLFTYALMDVLGSNSALSYQQLAQKIVARYESIPWRSSIPLFSATDLTKSVFDSEDHGEQQFVGKILGKELVIQGGALSMLTANSLVAIYSDPLAQDKEYLAEITIDRATAVTSYASVQSLETGTWPDNVYVRIIDSALNTTLNIAMLPSKNRTPSQGQALQAQLEKIVSRQPQFRLSEVDNASILVSQFDNKYWFLRADQSLPCEEQQTVKAQEATCLEDRVAQRLLNVSVPHSQRSRLAVIKNSLLKIANVERLLSSNVRLRGTQKHLKVEFGVKRGSKVQLLPVNVRPMLKKNDQILFEVKNISRKPQDINILFIDSQYGITQLHPQSGQPNRLQPNESLSFNWYVNVSTTGVEHLMLFSQISEGVGVSFVHLEQTPLQVSTRGFKLGSPPEKGGIELFSWEVGNDL
ncbi:caspase family protein [Vibrio sp. F74]|uniref:caspase family protein n=1 Tax=Vibrio sp. F74 TaxID=700020 RepID=UPI0035F565DE